MPSNPAALPFLSLALWTNRLDTSIDGTGVCHHHAVIIFCETRLRITRFDDISIAEIVNLHNFGWTRGAFHQRPIQIMLTY